MNPDSLHAQIMNLSCKPYDGTDAYTHYWRGFRDASHAAAELVAASAAAPQGAQPAEPVAVRYKNSGGRWRYLNLPFTKGWTFPESLGTPEPLYASPADAAPVPQEVRMLTVEEIVAVSKEMVLQRDFVDGSFANAIQIKSFEVNAGLTIPAKEQTETAYVNIPSHKWQGPGPQPAKWTASDGTVVYRSYEDYCDD